MSFSFTTDNSSQVLNNMNGASNATSVFITLSESSNVNITSNTFNTQIANYLSLGGGTLKGNFKWHYHKCYNITTRRNRSFNTYN